MKGSKPSLKQKSVATLLELKKVSMIYVISGEYEIQQKNHIFLGKTILLAL